MLSHTVGDFFMQGKTLLKLKEKGYSGILLHILILLVVTVFFCLPYFVYSDFLSATTLGIGVFFIHLFHFTIDYFKVRATEKFKRFSFHLFVLDQILHIWSISFVVIGIGKSVYLTLNPNMFTDFYFHSIVILYILVVLLATRPVEILKFVYSQGKSLNSDFSPSKLKMLVRAIIVSVVFALIFSFPSNGFSAFYDSTREMSIYSVSPEVMQVGDLVSIKGEGFGEKTKYSKVCWGNYCINEQSFTLWTDTEINFEMDVVGMPEYGTLEVLKLHSSGLYQERAIGPSISVLPKISGVYDSFNNKVQTLIPGQTLIIKGFYFGSGIGKLRMDSQIVNTKVNWSDSEVSFIVPEIKTPTSLLYLERKLGQIASFPIHAQMGLTNDPFVNLQGYLFELGMVDVFKKYKKGGEGVLIAIIDDGVDFSHPDLNGTNYVNTDEIAGDGKDNDGNGYIDDLSGYDFLKKSGSLSVNGDHGTSVAGIISAKSNNKLGISGIAPNAKIMPLVVCDASQCSGAGTSEAIRYAVDNGADIINMSLTGMNGSSVYDPKYTEVMKYASERGVFVVVSAGNGGKSNIDSVSYGRNFNLHPISPVCNDGEGNFIIGVASVDSEFKNSIFSDYGSDCIDISAFGEKVYSTTLLNFSNKLYSFNNGTSFSAPQVSGALALAVSEFEKLDYSQIRNALISTGKPLSSEVQEMFRGHFGNVLNIFEFLEFLSANGVEKLDEVITTKPNESEVGEDLFDDVAAEHPNYDAILYLKERGVLSGYSDGTFKPNNTVNRAELLKILIEGRDLVPDESMENCFTDVKDAWYAKYVCYAKLQGWVQGYEDGSFKPDTQISNVEAIKMLLEVMNVELETGKTQFKDVEIGSWYEPYVKTAHSLGLLQERGALFNPLKHKTRSSISENLYRLMKSQENS